jgi:hypothetical protein
LSTTLNVEDAVGVVLGLVALDLELVPSSVMVSSTVATMISIVKVYGLIAVFDSILEVGTQGNTMSVWLVSVNLMLQTGHKDPHGKELKTPDRMTRLVGILRALFDAGQIDEKQAPMLLQVLEQIVRLRVGF